MTYTLSNKKSLLIITLFALSAMLFLGVLALVILYNGLVSMEHGISDMRQELKSLQAENAELQKLSLALFDESSFRDILDTNLIIEKTPDYFESEQKWPLASQY